MSSISQGGEAGSSPHARGARTHPTPLCGCPRLIPACAGSTCVRIRVSAMVGAHPRMRGEHRSVTAGAQSMSGSSPHARGAQRSRGSHPTWSRLIPACAGSTRVQQPERPAGPAHPRMRGEHRVHQHRPLQQRGSSPHARGAHDRGQPDRHGQGLIPACAGSTNPAPTSDPFPAAHPRMRGEHGGVDLDGDRAQGSSPHARGARGRYG